MDIINVFRSVEPDQFPIFVARDLEKLPPILFDHLDCTKLLKDLLLLQNEIKEIKKEYVTQTQLKDLKTDLLKMQNDSLIPTSLCKLNMKRGGWLLESGPVGLSHVSNSSVVDDCNNSIDEISIAVVNQLSCRSDRLSAARPPLASQQPLRAPAPITRSLDQLLRGRSR